MHRTPMECSNAGACDRVKGLCKCQDGVSGKACEYLACPNMCSGKGSCVALSQAAQERDDYSLFREGLHYHGWEASRVLARPAMHCCTPAVMKHQNTSNNVSLCANRFHEHVASKLIAGVR